MSYGNLFYKLPGSLIWCEIFESLISIHDLSRFDAAITNKKLRAYIQQYIGSDTRSYHIYWIKDIDRNTSFCHMLYGNRWHRRTNIICGSKQLLEWVHSRNIQIHGIKITNDLLDDSILLKDCQLRRFVFEVSIKSVCPISYYRITKALISSFIELEELYIHNIDQYMLDLISKHCMKLCYIAGGSSTLSLIDILGQLPHLTKARVAALSTSYSLITKTYPRVKYLALSDYGFDYSYVDRSYFMDIDRIFPSLVELSIHNKIVCPLCANDKASTSNDVSFSHKESLFRNMNLFSASNIYGHGIRDILNSIPLLSKLTLRQCPLLCNYAICASFKALRHIKSISLSAVAQFGKYELMELVSHCRVLENLTFQGMIIPWAPPIKQSSSLLSLRFLDCDFSMIWSSWSAPSIWDDYMKQLHVLEFNECHMRLSDIKEMGHRVDIKSSSFRLILKNLLLNDRKISILRDEFPDIHLDIKSDDE